MTSGIISSKDQGLLREGDTSQQTSDASVQDTRTAAGLELKRVAAALTLSSVSVSVISTLRFLSPIIPELLV